MPDTPSPTPLTLTSRTANLIAAALLALLAILLITSVRQQSQTFDESTHLFAGFEYWRHGDFGRNPEHPPLVKMLAALPILSMGLHEPPAIPIPYFKGQDIVNAGQLIYSADADAILLRGRLVIVLFSLALGLLIFVATKEIFGPLAAVFALLLFTFEPIVLANGSLITTDMGLACLFFASVYAFYRYCKSPSTFRLTLCIAATALAIVAKHSGILILPTLLVLALADYFLSPAAASYEKSLHLRRLASAIVAICLVSYAALWAIYGFRYAARPGQLQISPPLSAYATLLHHPMQHSILAFLAKHHLFPEAYLYGWVDILLISDTRPIFLFGHLFGKGQWFFFPAIFLIKTTITLLLLLLLLPFTRIVGRRRELIFFSLPVAIFVLASISSLINMGVRYLLPIYPFLILFAGAAAATLFNRALLARVAVVALLVFTVISSLHAYPNFLAYSNEFAGGPSHTYRNVTDSNADWGQGLKWTRNYLDRHPDPNCWFDYYGNPVVNPTYYGIKCRPLISGFSHLVGFPAAPVPSSITGTVLISSTEVDGLLWGPGDLNPYHSFRNRAPDDIIENVILVYRGSFNVPLLAAESNASAASTLLRQGHLPQALALAQAAAQQAPNAADVEAVLGQTLLASGRLTEGHQAIAIALTLAKTNHPEYQQFLISQLEHLPSPP